MSLQETATTAPSASLNTLLIAHSSASCTVSHTHRQYHIHVYVYPPTLLLFMFGENDNRRDPETSFPYAVERRQLTFCCFMSSRCPLTSDWFASRLVNRWCGILLTIAGLLINDPSTNRSLNTCLGCRIYIISHMHDSITLY